MPEPGNAPAPSPAAAKAGHDGFCVLDMETYGGVMEQFPEGFRLLITGLRVGDTYAVYSANPASLAQLHRFLEAFPGPVVTYNGARFDLPLLDKWCRDLLGAPLRVSQHYDLMAEIVAKAGHRISLDLLCYYTFGEHKLSIGHHHRHGRIWAEEPWRLIEYNRQDVDLTHELFMRVLNGQYLFLGDASVVLPPPASLA